MRGFEVTTFIVAEKFSREFNDYLTEEQSKVRHLAKNSLENFKGRMNRKSCRRIDSILPVRMGIVMYEICIYCVGIMYVLCRLNVGFM